MKNILVIQHTQSIHHTNGMIGAWTDWDLSERGKMEAKNIANALKDELLKRDYILYSSDLKRALQTAEPLLEYVKEKPIITSKLREVNEGEATGKSREWYNEHKSKNEEGDYYSDYKAFPSSESYEELWSRMEGFMKAIITSESDNIIIVSHGVAMHLFYAMWIGIKFKELKKFGILALSGGVSKLILSDSGKREIQYLNNVSFKESTLN